MKMEKGRNESAVETARGRGNGRSIVRGMVCATVGFFIFAFPFPASSEAPGHWEGARPLLPEGYDAVGKPVFEMVPSGVEAIVAAARHDAIFVRRFRRGVWTDPISVTTYGVKDLSDPAVAVNEEGFALVAASGTLWNRIPVIIGMYGTPEGIWSMPELLHCSEFTETLEPPDLDLNAAGEGMVVFAERSSTEGLRLLGRLVIARRGVWNDPIQIFDASSVYFSLNDAQVAVDENGGALAMWEGARSGDLGEDLAVRRYTDGGWEEPVVLNEQPQWRFVDGARLAMNAQGKAVVLFGFGADSGDENICAAVLSGGIWQKSRLTPPDAQAVTRPCVSVDTAGGASAAFEVFDGWRNAVFFSTLAGETWTPAEERSPGGHTSIAPDVSRNDRGDALLALLSYDLGCGMRSRAACRFGGTWRDFVATDDNAFQVDAVTVRLDSSGEALLVYGAEGRIFANRYTHELIPLTPIPTRTPGMLTPTPTQTVEPVEPADNTPTPTPTAVPANFLELEIREDATVLGGTVTLEWAADPDRIWELMGRPVGIYFAVARGQGTTDGLAPVAEALSNERMYLFGTERGILEASPLDPLHIPATWDAVAFPLWDGATSGEMTFGVPADPSFRGDWVFEAAFRFLDTGEFVNRRYPVEVSNVTEVR
ncbi:MAG: exo-alpha-sialidase [Chlamydiae bacterium]|nr:exo-alpha-sialidase [Chlamydiota bacterium]